MKIFLSAVSRQFKECRQALASDLRAIGCDVKVQEDFQQRGRTLLDKLEEYIDQCDRVIAIVGDVYGFEPDEPARPDGRPRRSYTQWEYFFALGERLDGPKTPSKDLLVYLASPEFLAAHPASQPDDQAELQREFVDHIKASGKDRSCFDSADQLCRLALRDGWQMQHRPEHKPIHLPYRSIGTLFKGRDEFLEQLRQSLQRTAGQSATAIVGKAIHGLGGIGKTRLAVEYAWQHADDYSAVLFVTADSPENLRRNLAQLTGPLVLDIKEASETDEDAQVAAAVRWLNEHPGWFLIVDNVDDEKAAQQVEELLAHLHGGQVLITSRLNRWGEELESLELDVLAPEEGKLFLLEKTRPQQSGRGRTETGNDEEDALQLARELDGLALAMEQAGAYIAQLRTTLGQYLDVWRSHRSDVQAWTNRTMKYAGPSDAPTRSVMVTWQTTLDQLDEPSVTLLNLLAWFASDPIPLAIFRDLPTAAEDLSLPGEEQAFREAISNLADFNMLRWDSSEQTVTVHRVVQEILRTRQTEPERLLKATLNLLDAARPEGDPGDVRTWPMWDPLRPHVAYAVDEAERHGIDEPTSELMGALGTLLSVKALHAEAEQFKRGALAIDEQLHGPESTTVAARLNNLAQTLKATNRLDEAEPIMRRALAIGEKSFGGKHPDVALRLNNLAQLLQDTNRLDEAEPMMRRALAIDEQSFGSEHPRVAVQLNNLATLLKATNRLDEAEPMMRRAFAIDEQSFGTEHPNVATDLNNLARLLQATNRLDEAEPMMRRALAIDEKSFGSKHPNVAIDLNNLALLLQATNRLDEAEPMMRRHVEIFAKFRAINGHEHPHMQTAIRNYRRLLDDMNISDDEIERRVRSAVS